MKASDKRLEDAEKAVVEAAMKRKNKDGTYTGMGPRKEVLDMACERLAKLRLKTANLHTGVEPPKVGDDIYVDTSIYIDHGEDDVCGGLAEVISVKPAMSAGANVPFIEVRELPGRSYSWAYLRDNQARLKKEFKTQRAHPDPDLG
jgi:hypothetical protein